MGAVVNGANRSVNIQSKNSIEVASRQNVSIATDEGRKVSIKELEITDTQVSFQGEPLLKSNDIEDVVTYDKKNNIRARKNVTLKNGASLSGVTEEGNTYPMVGMTAKNQVELGSTHMDTILKSDNRPYIETRDGQVNQVAYLSDIENSNQGVEALSERVNNLEEDLNHKIADVQAGVDDLKEETTAGFGSVANSVKELEEEIGKVNKRVDETDERVDDLEDYLETLDSDTEKVFGEVNETLKELRKDVDENSKNITVNRTDIDQLREDFNNEQHFKGYYDTNVEIQRIEGAEGAYAWSAETGTVWIYDGNSWVDSGTLVPDQSVMPSDSLPLVDNVASAGSSTDYARGDHRHPTDDTRTAVTDLDNYLKLAGNTQSTPVSGDIWLKADQKLRVSDSGSSYVTHHMEKQETQLVGAGIGGLNLIAENGTVKANGEEVALKGEVEKVAGDLSSLKAEYNTHEEASGERLTDLETLAGRHQQQITTVNGEVDNLKERLEEAEKSTSECSNQVDKLRDATEEALTAVNGALEGVRTDVDTNKEKLILHCKEIQQLREDFTNEEHFKGYYETNDEIHRIEGAEGAYAWSAETGTVWVYDGNSWIDSEVAVPDQSVFPSDSLPLVDDVASAGQSTEYARGDHRHPTDKTRAAVTDLDNYLKLAGNSQSTKISGDIWLSSNQKLRLSDSGSSYVSHNLEKQETQVISGGIGGINLVAEAGTVKANGQEVALQKEVEQVAGDLSSLKEEYDALEEEAKEHLENLETIAGKREEQLTEAGSEIGSLKGRLDAAEENAT
ncbi:MAG: hypothetical protein LUD15_08605 [Bacteroides sp.]|nr:hypothetical protein [Bacteroides sp.]